MGKRCLLKSGLMLRVNIKLHTSCQNLKIQLFSFASSLFSGYLSLHKVRFKVFNTFCLVFPTTNRSCGRTTRLAVGWTQTHDPPLPRLCPRGTACPLSGTSWPWTWSSPSPTSVSPSSDRNRKLCLRSSNVCQILTRWVNTWDLHFVILYRYCPIQTIFKSYPVPIFQGKVKEIFYTVCKLLYRI